ncbi:hypothetical protein HELRODRAFT_161390 [Helobdella robusta]|uniref:BUD13 homolog n=1 Tax=Helobdella robusta TaxID=6412 RepID=T1ERF3_HELRO|nr:hypothetical protein HELRODRAFT_161390 [Helobdella robusta]ESO02153.1 hypothetical protein HELRODRAFT_161390 [Helobdella robusta]
MSKSDYLKKYLSEKETSKAGKNIKAKPVKKSGGMKIIDEDINMKQITFKNNIELYVEEDDVPLCVNIEYESEEKVNKLLAKFTTRNWMNKEEKSCETNMRQRHDSDSEPEATEKKNFVVAPSLTKNKISRRHSNSASSDASPPRKFIKNSTQEDADISPPRRCTKRKNLNSAQEDTDISPPRRLTNLDPDNFPARKQLKSQDSNSFEKDRDTEEIIYRDKGRKRDFVKEKKEKEKNDAKQKEKEEKYQQWGKGLKQKELKEEHISEVLHEVNKPLARYADDEDLDEKLKDVEREGDPMLEYIKKKKSKECTGSSKRPIYKGPEAMPNRFNIRPGYRWDGVDRSNGFEKQFFLKQNERKALRDMAYKWSTEDM